MAVLKTVGHRSMRVSQGTKPFGLSQVSSRVFIRYRYMAERDTHCAKDAVREDEGSIPSVPIFAGVKATGRPQMLKPSGLRVSQGTKPFGLSRSPSPVLIPE